MGCIMGVLPMVIHVENATIAGTAVVRTLGLEYVTDETILALVLGHREPLNKMDVTHWTGTLPGSVVMVEMTDHSKSTKMMW